MKYNVYEGTKTKAVLVLQVDDEEHAKRICNALKKSTGRKYFYESND